MIALDSSANICLVERVGTTHDDVRRLVRAHDGQALFSTLAITECMMHPLLNANTLLTDRYDNFFQSPVVRVDEVDFSIARSAAELRARFFLTTPDAVHFATALVARVATYVSTDAKAYTSCVGQVDVEVIIVPREPDPPRKI